MWGAQNRCPTLDIGEHTRGEAGPRVPWCNNELGWRSSAGRRVPGGLSLGCHPDRALDITDSASGGMEPSERARGQYFKCVCICLCLLGHEACAQFHTTKNILIIIMQKIIINNTKKCSNSKTWTKNAVTTSRRRARCEKETQRDPIAGGRRWDTTGDGVKL